MTLDIIKVIINKINNDKYLSRRIENYKAHIFPATNGIELCYRTTKHLEPIEYIKVKKLLNDYIGNFLSEHITISITQSHYCCELFDSLNSKQLVDKFCKDLCVTLYPVSSIFIPSTQILFKNKKTLELIVNNEFEQSFVKKTNLENYINKYFKNVYGLETSVTVRIGIPKASDYNIPKIEPAVSDTQHLDSHINKHALIPTSTDLRVKTIKISDLKLNKSSVIDIKIIDHQMQPIKNGATIKHTLILWDGEQSIYAVLFESKESKINFSIPKIGMFAKVEGKLIEGYKNRYKQNEKENIFSIKRFYPTQRTERIDKSEVKRVELHAHTQMSSMDGVTGVEEFIKCAAKWGHNALAITDHGVVQAFPDAYKAAKDNNIKVIYGTEAYLIDDSFKVNSGEKNHYLNEEYVVFGIEKTSPDINDSEIIKIEAVKIKKGKIIDKFSSLIKPVLSLTEDLCEKKGININELQNAADFKNVLNSFIKFCGKESILTAYNSDADLNFLKKQAVSVKKKINNDKINFKFLCILAYPTLKNFKLKTIGKCLKINFNDKYVKDCVNCAAKILTDIFKIFADKGIEDLESANELFDLKTHYKHLKTYHIILLAENKIGLTNLYRLISYSHVDYLYKKPRLPKSLLSKYRDGIIIGSACESGELFSALVENEDKDVLKNIADFYDYLEIQPIGNNAFLIKNGLVKTNEDLQELNKKIVDLGDDLKKPVVATCDVHFLNPEDEVFRRIIQTVQKYNNTEQPPLYFRTTDEMLVEFEYLGEKKANEVVVENSVKISDRIESIELFPAETAMPIIENAAEEITESAYKTAKKIYGNPLPDIVSARLKRELDSIVNNGFSVLYYSAQKLVKKSLEDGYLVGSRGSVGSSLAATMMGITEVNPLPPHYICPQCKHSDFNVNKEKYTCGPDLPEKNCPNCGAEYNREGYDIPFETFLGIDADKVPDIDLNFSGIYQNSAHKYTEELFGKGNVFRAGTISTLKGKNAPAYVDKFAEESDEYLSDAEKERLSLGVSGIKKTTGQHPGGMVIVPAGREIYEFTPVQWPADKKDAEFVTTHFDFNSMHDILIKLDILGHDAPTIIKILQDLTGIDPLKISLNDKKVLSLFSSIEALDINPKKLFGIKLGTLGIPEFGTKFVRQMLAETLPKTMEELIRISGLSHGTDVWLKNAQDLIKNGTCTLKEAICTRDDIMNYLVAHGVEKRAAFFIMEKVRKGKAAKNGFTDEEEKALKEAKIPNWFRGSCLKIKYMFPKAHAVAYTIMSLRIAYCKIYHKEAFYASYFTVRSDEFDGSTVMGGLEQIKAEMKTIEEKGKDITKKDESTQAILEVAAEMYLRGVNFLPVDLAKSDATQFLVEPAGIRLPFLSVPKLGAKLANKIIEEREINPFFTVDDFKNRCRIPTSVLEIMREMGVFRNIKESEQVSLFDN